MAGVLRGILRGGARKFADGQVLSVGAASVRLKVNPRARRVSLRLDPLRGEIVATAPTLRRLPEAEAFARERREWMEKVVDAAPGRRLLRPGLLISLEGRPCRLERAAMRGRARLRPGVEGETLRLLAFGTDAAFARASLRLLKALALERGRELTHAHLKRLGVEGPVLVSVADPRTRWGSCRQASPGRPAGIRYSWRLILAPPEIFDYVAAHEAAHLLEANHSKAFWAIVERLHDGVAQARSWLRANGRSLHALTP